MDNFTDILSSFFVTPMIEQRSEKSSISSEEKTFTFSTTTDNEFKVERYMLKGDGIMDKNIVIASRNIKENMSVLSDILHMLSLMKKVGAYSRFTYIVTSKENQKKCKKLLLDNPDLYFTDLIVKQTLLPDTIDKMSKLKEKTILVIDIDGLEETSIDKYISITGNIQIVMMSTKFEKIKNIFERLGENRILINMKEKLKALQQGFFRDVLKPLCKNLENVGFEEYFGQMNNDIFGAKYIIINKDEVYYY